MLNTIKKHRFIAILRSVPPDKLEKTAEALYKGGIRIMEVTFDPNDRDTISKTQSAFEMISNKFGNSVSLAAGTVVKPEFVTAAKKSGVQCIISPNTDEEIIRITKKNDMISIPGAFTPSEIVHAYKLGADIVKIFPILPNNISYLKTILSPISYIPFITTGGVNPDTADELIRTGAMALAAGASIITRSALESNNFNEIELNAKKHLDAINAAIQHC